MTPAPDPHLPTDIGGAATSQRRRIGVFVLVDGLGYELVREADFLPDFELRVGLRSVWGPADAVHASLLTGKTVAEHAISSRWVASGEHSVFDRASKPWRWLPAHIADSPFVRERIRRSLTEQLGSDLELPRCPTRLLPRFDLAFDEDLFGERTFGRAPSIFTQLAHWGVRWSIDRGDVPEALSLDLARSHVREGGCEFLFLRLPRLGQLLHRRGTAHAQVRAQLDHLAVELRRLQHFAEEMVEEVEFFVFGDRAALDVHGYVDLKREVEAVFGRNGDRVLAYYEETHARFWSESESTRRELEACLARIAQGRLLPEEELRALGWPASTVGDASWFVIDPGLAIHPNYTGLPQPTAAAGYHPDLPQTLVALLGSFSPSLDVTEVPSLHDLMEATAARILQDRA